MKTKIFCDIADIKQIKKFNKKTLVKGFTTNPSLIRKAGAKDYKSYCKKILKICKNKPVSFEVFADDYQNMKRQALLINKWAKKDPLTIAENYLKKKEITKIESFVKNQILKAEEKTRMMSY